jgi:hypothetical protein
MSSVTIAKKIKIKGWLSGSSGRVPESKHEALSSTCNTIKKKKN